jgi:flavin-dependent dehydrogenase
LAWWAQSYEEAEPVRLRFGAVKPTAVAAFPAFPRLMRPMHGPGWFAVGDAAACHDPLSGHGILYAFESAFRAAEMASLGTPLSKIGSVYEEALTSRFRHHMKLREAAYLEAAHRFPGSRFWDRMLRSNPTPPLN